MCNSTVIAEVLIRTAQKPQNLRKGQIRQASCPRCFDFAKQNGGGGIAESLQLSRPQQEYHFDTTGNKLFGHCQKIVQVPAFVRAAAARMNYHQLLRKINIYFGNDTGTFGFIQQFSASVYIRIGRFY